MSVSKSLSLQCSLLEPHPFAIKTQSFNCCNNPTAKTTRSVLQDEDHMHTFSS